MAIAKKPQVDEITMGEMVSRLIDAERRAAQSEAHARWLDTEDKFETAIVRWCGLVAIAVIVGLTVVSVISRNAPVEKPVAVDCKCNTAGERCTCGETCQCEKP